MDNTYAKKTKRRGLIVGFAAVTILGSVVAIAALLLFTFTTCACGPIPPPKEESANVNRR